MNTAPLTGKPYSEACERNREPILAVLQTVFADRRRVLEIGSGTGQHAAAFAAALPHLLWQCSDCAPNLPGISQWLAEAALPNTPPPLAVDVNDGLPAARFDAVYTANTLHIMRWSEVQRLFAALPAVLEPGARLVVYGPFNRGGHFTSASNAAFDQALRAGDPGRGIRDFEAVNTLAEATGLVLEHDHAMPANNRCIVWRQTP